MSNPIGQLQMLLTAMAAGQAPLARYTVRLPWRLGRIALLLGTLLDLLRCLLKPGAVIVTGPQLAHLQGRLTISSQGIARKAIGALRRGQPAIIIPFAADGNPLARLCTIIGFDQSDEIHALLSINAILVLMGESNGRPAIAHFATTPNALAAVTRHHVGLLAAERGPLPDQIKLLAPKVIGWRRDENGAALLQCRLPGTPGSVIGQDEATFRQQIERAMALLLTIDSGGRLSEGGPDCRFIAEKILNIPERLPQRYAEALAPATRLVGDWPSRAALRSVPVHGDFWLPNLMFDKNGEIDGLIDWEWYRDDGLPLYDAFLLLFVSTALRRGIHMADLIAQAWAPQYRDPWIAGSMERLSIATGISQGDQLRIAVVLWLSIIRRSHIDTGPRSDEWLERAISRPAALLHRHIQEQALA